MDPTGSWRQYLRTSAICLLLGLALNVSVAWCLLLGEWPCGWPIASMKIDGNGPIGVPRRWPCPMPDVGPPGAAREAHPRAFIRVVTLCNAADWGDRTHTVRTVQVGAPLASMQYSTMSTRESPWGLPSVDEPVPGRHGGLAVGDRYADAIVIRLPAAAIWPGFALDTALYAALAWLALIAPFTLRRTLRRRHHRCPACGYDTSGLEACPECGKPT